MDSGARLVACALLALAGGIVWGTAAVTRVMYSGQGISGNDIESLLSSVGAILTIGGGLAFAAEFIRGWRQ